MTIELKEGQGPPDGQCVSVVPPVGAVPLRRCAVPSPSLGPREPAALGFLLDAGVVSSRGSTWLQPLACYPRLFRR
jgi:hypothetical protein